MSKQIVEFDDLLTPISFHAFNKDRTRVAVSPNNHTVRIYRKKADTWEFDCELAEHTQHVTSIDWAPGTNKIVTCGADRNAYVWTETDKNKWKQTLVILRINRAATCARWSPNEDKFAIGTGARMICICFYDPSNDWWVSKHIKKPIRSSVLSLSWHPNNVLLACGTTDFKARIFSAYVKEVDSKPPTCCWGDKFPFGQMMGEYAHDGMGWVHSVSFSPDGNKLAWTSHDSSICVVDGKVSPPTPVVLNLDHLPLVASVWLNDVELVVAGYDNAPMLYTFQNGSITLKKKIDEPQAKAGAGNANAMSMFRNMDKLAQTSSTSAGAVITTHMSAVRELKLYSDRQFSSSAIDTKVVVWQVCCNRGLPSCFVYVTNRPNPRQQHCGTCLLDVRMGDLFVVTTTEAFCRLCAHRRLCGVLICGFTVYIWYYAQLTLPVHQNRHLTVLPRPVCLNFLGHAVKGRWVIPDTVTDKDRISREVMNSEIRKRMNWPLLLYREDSKCGPNHTLGQYHLMAQCDALSAAPCCNPDIGLCGSDVDSCLCPHCTDFRRFLDAEVAKWTTNSPACQPKEHNAEEACQIVRSTSELLLVGDSLVRQLFTALVLLLTGDIQAGALPENVTEQERLRCVSEFQITDKFCSEKVTVHSTDLLNPARICSGGLKTRLHLVLDYSKRGLPQNVRNAVLSMSDRARSYLLIGVGFHYHLEARAVIRTYIEPLLGLFQSQKRKFKPRILWLLPHGISGYLLTAVNLSNSRIHAYNSVLSQYFEERGVPYVNPHPMSQNIRSYDGRHHGLGFNILKANIVLQYLSRNAHQELNEDD